VKAAFYKGKRRLFNRLVSWWDMGPYSHMEIVFDDQTAASSSFMDGGVRIKSIQFDDSRWDFIELPRELFAEDISRDWFKSHLGFRYDFFGLIRFAIDAIPDRKSKYFCSEACLESLGISEAWRFTPNSAYTFLHNLIELKAKNV